MLVNRDGAFAKHCFFNIISGATVLQEKKTPKPRNRNLLLSVTRINT